jgi:hypothetical protein
MQSGGGNTAIGATRQVRIGEQQLHERLVALDDEEHILYAFLDNFCASLIFLLPTAGRRLLVIRLCL